MAAERGLTQISDTGALEAVVARVVAANPQPVADYRAGKETALRFLVGQVMKETQGRANPALVNQLLARGAELLEPPAAARGAPATSSHSRPRPGRDCE